MNPNPINNLSQKASSPTSYWTEPAEHLRPEIEPQAQQEELKAETTLRPQSFDDYQGQMKAITNIKMFVEAAKKRQQALDHTLFSGPPGLGKTSLALLVSKELGVNITSTSGPVLEKAGDLAAILTNLKPCDVLFIDEIHRLPKIVEETLYSAMEDFELDIIIGQGPAARTVKLPLPQFTLIGATTRAGLLSSPLRDRFGIAAQLEFYQPADLAKIVQRSARILGCDIKPEACLEIARRSRGTPRITNRLLRRTRDFAEIRHNSIITLPIAREGLDILGIDQNGLDDMDRKILETIITKFNGGPVGLDTISSIVGEESETIEEVYEPFLLQQGYVMRTPRGRTVLRAAYEVLNLAPPPVIVCT